MRKAFIELTSDIVVGHLSHNRVGISEISTLIRSVYDALSNAVTPTEEPNEPRAPAVSIRSSLKKDHLVCLDCGRRMKTLKRHILNAHGLSPEDYRARWNLSEDYPMVSSNYSAKRRALAVENGLGCKSSKYVESNKTNGS